VLEEVNPDKAQGLVRVEREQWSAVSADGQPIPVGARVEVMAVDGGRLKVRPLQE
jgi:membrane-bound ClpP family serine protease